MMKTKFLKKQVWLEDLELQKIKQFVYFLKQLMNCFKFPKSIQANFSLQ